MSTHMREHKVDHTSFIRYGLRPRYLSLVTTKSIANTNITSIVSFVSIENIFALTFVILLLSSHLNQLIAYILRYIEPLVLFKKYDGWNLIIFPSITGTCHSSLQRSLRFPNPRPLPPCPQRPLSLLPTLMFPPQPDNVWIVLLVLLGLLVLVCLWTTLLR